jgi:serine/threonine protein kinase
MSGLRDSAVAHLRHVVTQPHFGTDRYALIEEIGRGGMGVVFSAVDGELDREVAIKISHGVPESGVEERLRREARVLARLEHPGIVPVHDVGQLADGRLFYVMKRLRGQTLREYLSDGPAMGERLRIFERICEAVAFAHDAGVIHRDLKPENVMLGAFGEVMVMDWGVAKLLRTTEDWRTESPGSERLETQAGTVIGTPGFMPPEQAGGDAAEVDVRADVFSLGAILFMLLTDRAPDRAEDPQDVILRTGDVRRPLRAICARALALRREDRYASVAALIEDVARFRSGQAVTAHRETILERAVRLAGAHRVAILLVLGYIIMRIAVALLAGW